MKTNSFIGEYSLPPEGFCVGASSVPGVPGDPCDADHICSLVLAFVLLSAMPSLPHIIVAVGLGVLGALARTEASPELGACVLTCVTGLFVGFGLVGT